MDRRLVERAIDGDRDAFASLALLVSDSLYAVAYRPFARTEQTELDLRPARCAGGESLPTLPLHPVHDRFVPVDLDDTNTEARRHRRMR